MSNKKRFIVEVSENTFNRWKAIAENFTELPEDYNPNDYAGGNMDDAFENGQEFGYEEAINDVFNNIVEEDLNRG